MFLLFCYFTFVELNSYSVFVFQNLHTESSVKRHNKVTVSYKCKIFCKCKVYTFIIFLGSIFTSVQGKQMNYPKRITQATSQLFFLMISEQ